jgi:hypothetical protein
VDMEKKIIPIKDNNNFESCGYGKENNSHKG